MKVVISACDKYTCIKTHAHNVSKTEMQKNGLNTVLILLLSPVNLIMKCGNVLSPSKSFGGA